MNVVILAKITKKSRIFSKFYPYKMMKPAHENVPASVSGRDKGGVRRSRRGEVRNERRNHDLRNDAVRVHLRPTGCLVPEMLRRHLDGGPFHVVPTIVQLHLHGVTPAYVGQGMRVVDPNHPPQKLLRCHSCLGRTGKPCHVGHALWIFTTPDGAVEGQRIAVRHVDHQRLVGPAHALVHDVQGEREEVAEIREWRPAALPLGVLRVLRPTYTAPAELAGGRMLIRGLRHRKALLRLRLGALATPGQKTHEHQEKGTHCVTLHHSEPTKTAG